MIRQTERILNDVQNVMAGLETLVANSADRAEERIEDAAGHMRTQLEDTRERLADIEHEIEGGVRRAARAAGETVRASPWTSLATMAGVAFLCGLALSRRGSPSGDGAGTNGRGKRYESPDDWLDASG